MPDHKEPIPLDVFHRILSFVPSIESHTLASLLRLDKACCIAVAPKLYTYLRITPYTDLRVDTGLPASTVYGSSDHIEEIIEGDKRAGGSEQNKGRNVEIGDSARMAPQHGQTLKAHLLSLIRTIDIHHSPPTAQPSEIISKNPPQQRSIPPLHLDQVTIHLDTSHPARLSPFARLPSTSEQVEFACISLLKIVRPRRFVIKGASFTMTAPPELGLPLGLFEAAEDIILVITAGALPEAGFAGYEYGATGIYPALCNIGQHMTFLLQTSKPTDRFKVIHRPYTGMPMTMEYHPDYAPGYLNPLTMDLAYNISLDWGKAINESRIRKQGDMRRRINLVNFGSLDGEEMGMPQAATEEVENRFRRGMNIRIKQNVSRMPTLVDMENRDNWKDYIKVLGMKEWLKEDRGRMDVLDEADRKSWL